MDVLTKNLSSLHLRKKRWRALQKKNKKHMHTCDVNYKDINYGGNICHYGNIKHMMYIEFDHKAYKMLAYLPCVIDTSPLCYCINCGLASHSYPLNPHKPTSLKSPPCYFFFSSVNNYICWDLDKIPSYNFFCTWDVWQK